MVTRVMTPFEKGWLAAEAGLRISQNPYPADSGYGIWWRNGYRAFYDSFKVEG